MIIYLYLLYIIFIIEAFPGRLSHHGCEDNARTMVRDRKVALATPLPLNVLPLQSYINFIYE